MATTSLVLYNNNSTTTTYDLVTTGTDKTVWKVASRALACPRSIEIQRKPTASSATSNDHVIVRAAVIERNTSTQKLATGQVVLDLSIPKDGSIITNTVLGDLLANIASLLNEKTVMEATRASINAIVEGRDF